MTIWFTSDQHYFHKNIISHCNRPFKDINKMHQSLIKNHNNYVENDDICYHIGDFTFLNNTSIQRVGNILGQLKGRNILILGNHDPDKPHTLVNMGFESVHTSLVLPEDTNFILCHDPACSIVDRDKTWIVGHVHDLFIAEKNCINVGVDIWDFKPVSLEMIREMLPKY